MFEDVGELPHPPPGQDVSALEWMKQQVWQAICTQPVTLNPTCMPQLRCRCSICMPGLCR
eukprot:351491-Chlamydomonas_euryale.AAC.43